MESYSISLILTSKAQFEEDIIDPISFILINWGIPETLIDWQIYQNKATLQVNYSIQSDDYIPFSINYQEFNSLLELCYDYDFIFKITCFVDKQSSTIEYHSPFNETTFSVK